jgi:hypothetical protein
LDIKIKRSPYKKYIGNLLKAMKKSSCCLISNFPLTPSLLDHQVCLFYCRAEVVLLVQGLIDLFLDKPKYMKNGEVCQKE